MKKQHHYQLSLRWNGNLGEGTLNYKSYARIYTVHIDGKPVLEGSSDPYFRGDQSKHNPEDMLISSLSACHMLSYLHVCAVGGVVVVDYLDNATGLMETTPDGSGRFLEVTLNPVVTVADASMIEKANAYHARANQLCFIANSVNFPVKHVPEARVKLNVTFKL
ncbi:Organic hydroperoxide reductase OsmC/OhrA [Pedobacter westerhofensis]|uniref:Organic hydroperoxide reductase OsmC/OhrA n=1 Tax=Pedobacter westerhofensis TaxID=425512 RepID=A0A521D1F6_9SPHI|nr:OsmC family protein [Pedobacter westerhofensis]SMO64841.1 Organic hydroperoxide reductase OsmC/OhrA [Pedobacter westerhofensis]